MEKGFLNWILQRRCRTLGLLELGEPLPGEYASDDANILLSQNQHPGIHPEFSRAASLTPEKLREMLVTLGKKQCDSSKWVLTFIAILPHEKDERGTTAGREFSLCVLLNYKSKDETPKPWVSRGTELSYQLLIWLGDVKRIRDKRN